MIMVVTLNGRHLVKLIGHMIGVRKQVMIMAMATNQPNQFQTQISIPILVAWKTERTAHRLNPKPLVYLSID